MNKIKLSDVSKRQLSLLIVRWCNLEKVNTVYKSIGISRDLCYKWRNGMATYFTDDMAYKIAVELGVLEDDLLAFLNGMVEFEKFWATTKYKKRKPVEKKEVVEEVVEKTLPSPVLSGILDYWELLSGSDKEILRFRLGIIKNDKPYNSFPLIRFTNSSQYQLAQVVVKICRDNVPLSEWIKDGIKAEILDLFFNNLRSDIVTIASKYWHIEDFLALLKKIRRIKLVEGSRVELEENLTYEDDADAFFIDCHRYSHPNEKRSVTKFINDKIKKNKLTQELINLRLNAFDFDLNRWRAFRYGKLNPSTRELAYLKAIIDPVGDPEEWKNIAEIARIEESVVLNFTGRKTHAVS